VRYDEKQARMDRLVEQIGEETEDMTDEEFEKYISE
jgi:hypothetical protein